MKQNKPIKSPTLVLEDDQSTIKAVKDLALHSRTKHTLLKYRYIREVKQAGIFDILYIDTVTGLGPDYVPGSWPEPALVALQFRQEPPFPCK